MRRKDKQITDRNELEEILTSNQICRVAFSGNNFPYIVPMNYGYLNNKIFFHSASEGKKIDIINKNKNVCFEISDSIELLKTEKACDFGTKYRSVIGFGQIEHVSSLDNKIEALQVIMKQHTGTDNWEFNEKIVEKITVLKIEIKSLTGKKSGFKSRVAADNSR